MPSDLAIQIDELSKTYQPGKGRMRSSSPKEALKEVNLHIPRGSFYGLLGPNGAGKSTLINILAGLVRKTSGTVIIDGMNQDQQPEESRRHIGIVPQEVVLDPFFSIEEMLEHYAGFYGIRKGQRRTRELLEALKLTDKAQVNSRRLSGGMKRRVLIAKALVHNPPIIVLDEPTAGVDVELRTQLWDYVRELNRQGTTVLLTTHYLEEAQELCDHISIINHGQVIVSDSKQKLMQSMDQKQMTVTFSEAANQLPASLAHLQQKQITPQQWAITYQPSRIGMDEILHQLSENRLRIRDISTTEADLEDIFRHIIAEKKAG